VHHCDSAPVGCGVREPKAIVAARRNRPRTWLCVGRMHRCVIVSVCKRDGRLIGQRTGE